MMVDLVNVYYPPVKNEVYDYSKFQELDHNILIPLEIIYRNFLPKESSVFKRLSKGELNYTDLWLDAELFPGTHLQIPFIDFSTKLEITDWYISSKEAQDISGLSDDEMEAFTDVDVLGTLDECRFELNGLHLSKEVARMCYRNSDWLYETERAKEKDRQKWKKECKLQPEPLLARFKFLLSQMYCKVTNEITEREWFEVPFSLNEIVEKIKTCTK